MWETVVPGILQKAIADASRLNLPSDMIQAKEGFKGSGGKGARRRVEETPLSPRDRRTVIPVTVGKQPTASLAENRIPADSAARRW